MTAIIISGCTENKKSEEQYLADAKLKLEEKKYDEAIADYREFLKNYPKSDKAIFAYNEIAGIQISNLNNPQEGIKTYIELAEKHPDTKEAKQSLFMVAFIYDETLKDKENAMASYQKFLDKYPKDNDENDKMSESARTMLEVLKSGKSIEEIIEENIRKSGGDVDTTGTTETKGTEDADNKIKRLENESKEKDMKKESDNKIDPAQN
ncbi:MAG: tetratricopeptide repeat protein [Ignavibacteria bacterium]|nr:tetratricopeptide repeat protein [Ignavibacteria bacterium]